MAKFITVHHPKLKLQSSIPEAAFAVRNGYQSKGWAKGPLPEKKKES